MKMKSINLPAVLLAVITAAVMVLAAGMFSQAYAAEDDYYYIQITTPDGEYTTLPGKDIKLYASLWHDFDGETIIEESDVELKWELDEDDAQFAKIKIYSEEPNMAFVKFKGLPEGQTELEAVVRASVTAYINGEPVATDDIYLNVDNDYYELYPDTLIDQIGVGEEQEAYASVIHYTVGGPDIGEQVKNVKFTWDYDESEVDIKETGKMGETAVYSIKRLQPGFAYYILRAEWTAEDGETMTDGSYFWFKDIPTDLNEYRVVLPQETFDGWDYYVDSDDEVLSREDLEENTLVYNDNFNLKNGQDYELRIDKYDGYDEESGDIIWVPYEGDLKIDPKDSGLDRNGRSKEGNAVYRVYAVGKEGTIYTGETTDWDQYIFMYSSKALTDYQAWIEFPSPYGKWIDEEPYFYYEVKPGTTLESVVTVNDERLVEDTDFTSYYMGLTVDYLDSEFPTDPGEYVYFVQGKGEYYGTSHFEYIKIGLTNVNFSASGKTLKVKLAKKAKKTTKKATFTKAKAFKVSGALGAVKFEKVSGNSKITVSSAGKVTVKKGLKKGTYKVSVKVTDAGDETHLEAAKTVTLKVKVA